MTDRARIVPTACGGYVNLERCTVITPERVRNRKTGWYMVMVSDIGEWRRVAASDLETVIGELKGRPF